MMPTYLPRGQTALPMPLTGVVGLMVASSDGVGGGLEAVDTGATPDSGEPDSGGGDTAAVSDPQAIAQSASTDPVGTSGDRAVLANLARAAFEVSGAGVTIGILSDSFNVKGGYAADQISGALPAGVRVLSEGPAGGSDEGRAMGSSSIRSRPMRSSTSTVPSTARRTSPMASTPSPPPGPISSSMT